ncbi:hypothetical protein [Streptomyces wuyuanensis]|uniref:hypothetical protein n=1 Tax=Streptomyces wuyuanensis TaxID=1196353 RepID=UPI003432C52B
MLTVTFTVRPGQGDPNGFDLGDMVFEGELGTARSTGRVPDAGMMIYLSVTLLLDGLRQLLDDRRKVVHFTAVDSSFGLVFRRNKAGASVSSGSEVIARTSRSDLAEAVLAAAENLEASGVAALPGDDVGRADYVAALDAFRAVIPAVGEDPGAGRRH